MKRRSTPPYRRLLVAGSVCLLGAASGCAPVLRVRATHYDIHVSFDPPQHRIAGEAELLCVRRGPLPATMVEGAAVEFELHPDLHLTHVSADCVDVLRVQSRPAPVDAEGRRKPTMHRVTVDRPAEAFRMTFRYEGELAENVDAGEKRGAIHNFAVTTHIGENGIYLDASGRWYPMPVMADDAPPSAALARYRLTVDPFPGYTFVAGADSNAGVVRSPGGLVARSRFPQTGMVLVGGRFHKWSREVNGVRFAVLLRADAGERDALEDRAELFLAAAVDYMKRYEPFLGKYPFGEFTIVENFFSSGFAFPTFTLLGPAVIQMGRRSLRHGYLDHELLHSWWGSGVYVDPDAGNWCEALASFGGNLFGYVLDGDHAGARSYRRDVCNMLSRLSPEKDKPLSTFGLDGGAGRGIGYQKGAMVFHMLSREMGMGNFWAAMRALTGEYTGRFINWTTIQSVCERYSPGELGSFFRQWVHGEGVPQFTLMHAWMADPGAEAPAQAYVRIAQTGGAFAVDLPLRIHNGDGTTLDVVAHLSQQAENVRLEGVVFPAQVELDPDYHVIRKLSPSEVMPTLACARRGDACNVLVPPGKLWEGYELFIKDLEEARKTGSVTRTEIGPSDLYQPPATTLAIVGEAVRNPDTQALLERSSCPIRWRDGGFSINGTLYADPSHAVLCTIRHADAPERTITVYYGNSPRALSNAGILWFYGNSLLVYETPEASADAQDEDATPRTTVIRRMDFEVSHRIPLKRSP